MNKKLGQRCADCVISYCIFKDSDQFMLNCPADQQAEMFAEMSQSLQPLSCPVCESWIDEGIHNGALLKKAQERLEKLHPVCITCDELFATCAGTSIVEWEALWNDPGRDDELFCHDIMFLETANDSGNKNI